MANKTINKAIKTTKAATAIANKAGNKMIRTSFKTVKKIAGLYKDAGMQAFKLGSSVVKDTVKLTVENQKVLLKTSGDAFVQVAKQWKEENSVETKKQSGRKTARKSNGRKRKTS